MTPPESSATPGLAPCPFCGGKAVLRTTEGWNGIGCETDKCPAYLHALMFRTPDEAAGVWNRRTDASLREPSPPGLLALADGRTWRELDGQIVAHQARLSHLAASARSKAKEARRRGNTTKWQKLNAVARCYELAMEHMEAQLGILPF